uniref:Uncharacterized protein n=1 Tax=Pyxicephalus adspersus TaxID=30357 RepID=A0AAV3B361_PYXAD|nr:TPA: hypothetical protein GDO54_002122 [Pyxicephalus adspersus]
MLLCHYNTICYRCSLIKTGTCDTIIRIMYKNISAFATYCKNIRLPPAAFFRIFHICHLYIFFFIAGFRITYVNWNCIFVVFFVCEIALICRPL